jgi:hypothetical protein
VQPPDTESVKDLLDWTPGGGVLSVYLAIDPADRGGGWRIELRDCVAEALAGLADAEHGMRLAARATEAAVIEGFPENVAPPPGRGHLGFVQLAEKGAREERWFTTQMAPRRTQAAYGPRPYVRPLVELLDEGRRVGVVVISGEFARLLESELGTISELDGMEILMTGDWRERKGPRPVGQARGVTTSTGRDQHEQRLADNRARFVKGVAGRVREVREQRGWSEIIAFGENEQLSALVEAVGRDGVKVVRTDVLNEEPERIGERLREIGPDLNRARELRLIERAEDAAQAGGRGTLGGQETAQALAEGRVQHLLLDADRDMRGLGIERAFASERGDDGGLAPGELLVESALRIGAAVTPVAAEAADRLDAHGGVAAILRY